MPLPKKLPSQNDNKFTPPPLPDIEDTVKAIPEEDEGEFTPLSTDEVEVADEVDEIADEQVEDYVEEMRDVENQNYVPSGIKSKGKAPLYDDPFEEGSDPEDDPDKFINKKKLKIKPFGGKKSKQKDKNYARAKDFDDRKNSLTLVRLLRLLMIVIVLGLFGMGIKNTFFPAHVYTQEDISVIAQQAIGQTGFPMNRGRAFAEQFTQAYFEFNTEDDNSGKVLNSFYKGRGETAAGAIEKNGKNIQKVLVPPKVFSENAVSENIAYYYVNTLVSDRHGNSFNSNGEQSSKWIALAVTVYFDTDTQELSIAKDSPQIIPSYEVGDVSVQPDAEILGTGQAVPDLYDTMKPTIDGFLKAYANSSTESHAEIDQYVKAEPDPSLYAGFGGKFKIPDETLDSSTATIYPVSESENNNEWKVDLTVTWEDITSVDIRDNLSYKGRYVMTLEKTKDGKYFVTAFRPYVYTPKTGE